MPDKRGGRGDEDGEGQMPCRGTEEGEQRDNEEEKEGDGGKEGEELVEHTDVYLVGAALPEITDCGDEKENHKECCNAGLHIVKGKGT